METLEVFKNNIREILEKYPKTILVKASLGDLNFKELEVTYDSIISILRFLLDTDLRFLKHDIINTLGSHIYSIKQVLIDIDNFKINLHDSINQHGNLINRFNSSTTEFIKYFSTWFPVIYLNSSSKIDDELIKKSHEDVNKIKDLKDLAEKLIDNIRNSSSQDAPIQFAHIFKAESDKYHKISQYWFWTTFTLFALTILFAYALLTNNLPFSTQLTLNSSAENTPVSLYHTIQFTSLKILLFFLLTSAIIWTGRIYKINKHLETVNLHRSNSLRTFQTFKAGSSDKQIQDFILMEAAKTIFSHVPTGFMPGDEQFNIPTQVIELIKNSSNKNL